MRTRRAVAAMTAGCLAVGGAALTFAAPAGAAPGFEFERLQGADRYATAAAIARDSFANADVALLANGQSDDPRTSRNESHFPDALAGNYLAGFRQAPTLLTTEDRLPDATSSALTDLGVETVVIIGGPAAVSTAQEQSLRNRGLQVQRVSGQNRYATAAAVARAPGIGNVGSVNGRRTAIVASGVQFPDALVMGPLSYAGQLPLTITDPQRLSPETRSVLDDFDIQQVLIPGGESAVSREVQAEIERLGITVTRFAGSGRTETARLVAEYALANLSFTDAHVNLALGLRFPDALAGGPHAGRDRAPILLTVGVDTLGAAARGYLEDHSDTLQDGHVFGGTAAVSSNVVAEAEAAARGDGTSPSPSPSPSTSPPATALVCDFQGSVPNFGAATDTQTVTTRPELVQAQLATPPSVNTAGTTALGDDFCTTQVRFLFDEPVIGKAPVVDRFHLVGFDAARRFTAQSAVIESGGTSVLATFGRGDDPATSPNERQSVGAVELGTVSLATVDQDAVADNNGQGNPLGDQPFGQSRETPLFAAGITAGPDLLTARSETSTANIAFEFDEPAFVVRNTGFHVVTTTNRDVTCTGPTASGTTVRATCPVTTGETPARAYVESDSVSDSAQNAFPGTDGDLNVLQSADLQGGGTTFAPDLVRGDFGSLDTPTATIVFTFDEPVFIGDGTRFVLYQQDTGEFRSTGAVRQSDPTQVLARFAAEDDDGNPATDPVSPLRNAVGVSVLEGAVIQAGGSNLANQEDEEAVANPRTLGITAGLTTGPDLTSVSVASNGSAVYTFDENLTPRITFTALRLYRADGTLLTCQTGSLSSQRTVTCTAFTVNDPTLGGAPRPAQPSEVQSAVLGAADNSAVQDSGGRPNPEGAERTGGSTGTPQQ